MLLLLIFSIFSISSLHFSISQEHQTIITSFSSSDSPWTPNQHKILVSPNSTFAAGFSSLPTSPNLFTFSVWYFSISNKTIVWSANENSPVSTSASLFISPAKVLTLVNDTSSGQNLWPLNPASNTNTSELILQENGNLVFGTWQSFGIPTNSILPGQNITGTTLSSKNGKFKFLDSNQLILRDYPFNYWSNVNAFLGIDDLGKISMANNLSYISSDYGDQKLRRLTLDEDGNLRLYSFDPNSGQWMDVWRAVYNLCRIPGICGLNSVCVYDPLAISVSCICPPGFRQNLDDPNSCDRIIPMKDMAKTKFLRLDYVNFSGGGQPKQIISTVSNLTTCQAECLGMQNCLAFLFRFDGNNSCILHLDGLFYGFWATGVKGATFLRVDNSETATEPIFTGLTSVMETSCPVTIRLPFPPEESSARTRNIVIISIFFAAELISGVYFFWAFLKKYTKYRDMARIFGLETMPAGGPKRFSYSEIRDATDNFSHIIGRGSFGIVYKGNLRDGRVVAVKYLKNVTGGDADFWAEVTIIARMHHLNLVTLWGFCTEKGKRILVYEYVANGSLDKFLFQKNEVVSSRDQALGHEQDSTSGRKPVLELNIRYRIAVGVARAIAYLHEECLEWVLHCDIKPENILLGEDFCPKVSDFGLAKLRTREDRVSMSGIRGTRGYLAPEWVRGDRQITSKSDVYSFGMVLLELVTGVRNLEQQNSNMESDQWYLPMWAFDKVFKEMNVDDILDPRIREHSDSRAHMDMVDRMVKTAMWCVQDRADDRPSMGKVAKMLEGTVEITEPKRPTIFYLGVDGGNGTQYTSTRQ
ncbi:OLC1v1033035C1 [Oldenlandia corymbosa var. corymbosa]|uniref:Receptor-like serine/threonine-protein kinase n=1 Tax=Oldenlandia corymbosa var. corymbosa TaxID=529605 RepID=A0AAV1CMC6_OLDCO|nr:OLC1v1033035C1 [Oldenlandia corymbosa var. corymbosa]